MSVAEFLLRAVIATVSVGVLGLISGGATYTMLVLYVGLADVGRIAKGFGVLAGLLLFVTTWFLVIGAAYLSFTLEVTLL